MATFAAHPPVPTATSNGSPVEVRRSARRTRTVSAAWRNGTLVVSIPARFTRAQEAHWVATMIARLERRPLAGRAAPPVSSDADLMRRAEDLSRRYLGGRARPVSVRWVRNQNSRWGSATPARATIRLSDKLQGMPDWVVDYVLLHELAHLIVPSHGPAFWRLLEAYPRTETAKAYLSGAAFASSRGLKGDFGDSNGPDADGPEDGADDVLPEGMPGDTVTDDLEGDMLAEEA